jgi:hypothetical protein
LRSQFGRIPQASAGFGQLGSAMAWVRLLPQRRFGFARDPRRRRRILVRLLLEQPSRLGSGERPAYFALLLLVGVEPPELASGHRFGECRIRTDPARTQAKRALASDSWLESGTIAAPTRANACAQIGDKNSSQRSY